MVEVTKFVENASLNNYEYVVRCDLMTLPNINNGARHEIRTLYSFKLTLKTQIAQSA